MKYRQIKQPLQNSYWIVPGLFLAGEYPRTKDLAPSVARLEAMVSAGITYFIDLTTSEDQLEPYDDLLREVSERSARRYSFGIRDVGTPENPGLMVAILNAIDQALCAGNGVSASPLAQPVYQLFRQPQQPLVQFLRILW